MKVVQQNEVGCFILQLTSPHHLKQKHKDSSNYRQGDLYKPRLLGA